MQGFGIVIMNTSYSACSILVVCTYIGQGHSYNTTDIILFQESSTLTGIFSSKQSNRNRHIYKLLRELCSVEYIFLSNKTDRFRENR